MSKSSVNKLKDLAMTTSYTPHMQRYYLACLDEFGPDLVEFVKAMVKEAEDNVHDSYRSYT